MPKSFMAGARIPLDWHEKINHIAKTAGKKQFDVVRAAIAAYLGEIGSGKQVVINPLSPPTVQGFEH